MKYRSQVEHESMLTCNWQLLLYSFVGFYQAARYRPTFPTACCSSNPSNNLWFYWTSMAHAQRACSWWGLASPPCCCTAAGTAICVFCCYFFFLFFNDICQTKMHPSDHCQIFGVGRTVAVDDQSEINFLIHQGTLPSCHGIQILLVLYTLLSFSDIQ